MSKDNKDKPAIHSEAEGSKGPGGLLEKIKTTLANTPAERWEQGGEDLDPSKKHQRAQESWEQLYCTDTKTGVLVLRYSIPVVSNFFAGGYSFVESGIPRYMIELRPRGWTPRMIIDPHYRGAGAAERSHQVLADGDVARQLYIEVHTAIKQYRESLRRDFNDSVERLIAGIREQVQMTAADDWQAVEGEDKYTGYRADINGMTVTVGCLIKALSAMHSMNFSKYGLKWDCRDSNLCKEIFAVVDESVRQSSLEQLGKVLDEML